MKLGTITQDHNDRQFHRLIRHFKKEKRKLGKDYSNGFISLSELLDRMVLIRILENLIHILAIDFLPTVSLYVEQHHQFMPNLDKETDQFNDLNLIMDCLLEKRSAPSEIWSILEKVEKEQSKNNQN